LYVSLRGVGRMSAIGTKRTFHFALHMSALGGKADTALSRRGSAIPSKLSAKFARGGLPCPRESAFCPTPLPLSARKNLPPTGKKPQSRSRKHVGRLGGMQDDG
jgi:hypothetical protein